METSKEVRQAIAAAHRLRSEALTSMALQLKRKVAALMVALRAAQTSGIEAGRYVNQI